MRRLTYHNPKVSCFEKKGLSAIALNADTISAFWDDGKVVWRECARGAHQIVLCSPEQLGSSDMVDLIFAQRLSEAYYLGRDQRSSFDPYLGRRRHWSGVPECIGMLRSLRDSGTVYLGLSATLLSREPTNIVKERPGFDGPKFSFMKLDWERTKLHIILRCVSHAFKQNDFADLDWLVLNKISCPRDIPNTLIYVNNLMRGHALIAYLRALLPAALQSKATTIVRQLHASTYPQCKDDGLDEFSSPESNGLRLAVATEAFGCGVDIPDIEIVVNFGTSFNLDSLYQQLGRAARRLLSKFGYVCQPQALGCHSGGYAGRTREFQAIEEDAGRSQVGRGGRSSLFRALQADAHLKRECLIHRINLPYDNTLENIPERCGRCSGCVEDHIPGSRESSVKETIPQSQPQLE